MTVEGMQEVCCLDCGASLGWQDAQAEVNRAYWRHSRCPVAIAKSLELTRDAYDALFRKLALVLTGCYPDWRPAVQGEAFNGASWQMQRAEIAAGMVLEALAASYTLRP